MKKILLLVSIFIGTYCGYTQQLLSENFNSLLVGNIGTELTGATAGQGGWLTFASNGSSPTTTTNANNSNFQIVSGSSNSLKITGPNGSKGSRFMFKSLSSLWNSRTTGNNILEIEVDVYRPAANQSKNNHGIDIFSADGKVLTGFSIDSSTGELTLVVYSDSTDPQNWSWSLAASPGVIIPANQITRIGISYNFTTGKALIITSAMTNAAFVDGLAISTVPDEIDFYSFSGTTSTTNNAAANDMIYDNLVVKATSTDSLLKNENYVTNESFKITPNPASDYFNISSTNNIGLQSISLTDMNGRVIKSISYENVSSAQINVSDLTAGMYMIQIKSENGSATKKVMIK